MRLTINVMKNMNEIRLILVGSVLMLLVSIFISCEDEVSAVNPCGPAKNTRAPSAPSEVYAEKRGGAVFIFWAPNPESDVRGYNIYRTSGSESDLIRIGTASRKAPDPYQYCFRYENSAKEGRSLYLVLAVDYNDNESSESQAVTASEPHISITEPELTAGSEPVEGKERKTDGKRLAASLRSDIYVESERSTVPPSVKREGNTDLPIEPVIQNT